MFGSNQACPFAPHSSPLISSLAPIYQHLAMDTSSEHYKEQNRVRFETELEVCLRSRSCCSWARADRVRLRDWQFVQCLANPFYLQCEPPTPLDALRLELIPFPLPFPSARAALAQQGLFQDEAFLK